MHAWAIAFHVFGESRKSQLATSRSVSPAATLSVGGLLSASLVIETIMSWPGLGPLLLDAVAARDLHVVVAAVTCSTVLLIMGNLLADGLLYLADPRMRPMRA